MKILNKYILKEFGENFIIYFGIISLLFFLNSIYQLIKPLISHTTSFNVIIKLFLFLFPSVISLSLPITILLVTLLTFSSMKECGEITIINTLGLKRINYTKNIIFLACIISAIMFYFNGYISPKSQRNFKNLYTNFLLSSPIIKFSDKTFINFSNKKIFVNTVEKNVLHNVYIYNPINNDIIQIISAKNANFETNNKNDIVLNLNNGRLSLIDKKQINKTMQMLFEKYIFIIYSTQIKNVVNEPDNLRELTNKDLLTLYDDKNQTTTPKNVILTEYFLRHTLSLSIFFFVLIGTILGLNIKHNSKPISFIITIFITGIYYFILSSSLTFSQRISDNNILKISSFFVTLILTQIPNFVLLVLYLTLSRKYNEN